MMKRKTSLRLLLTILVCGLLVTSSSTTALASWETKEAETETTAETEEASPKEKEGMEILPGIGTSAGFDALESEVGAATLVPPGYKRAVSEEQGFSTLCKEEYTTRWSEDGLYIHTGQGNGIPYVLIYRYENVNISAEDFLTKYVAPDMEEYYGDDLVDESEVTMVEFYDKELPGMAFDYYVQDTMVEAARFAMNLDGDLVSFIAKYTDENDEETWEALEVAVNNFKLDGTAAGTEQKQTGGSGGNGGSGQGTGGSSGTGGNSGGGSPSGGSSGTGTETAQVTWENYADPYGYFSLKIPKGWKVKTGLIPTGEFGFVSFAVTVYDPDNTDRMFYYNMSNFGMLKSQAAKEWYQKYYPSMMQAQAPVATEVSAKGFFEGANNFYYYTGFKVLKNLGTLATGGDLLIGRAKSTQTGKMIKGLFTASIMDQQYIVQKDMWDYSQGFVDIGNLFCFQDIMMTAPEAEYEAWIPVLSESFASIRYSEKFKKARKEEWEAIMGTVQYFQDEADYISGLIMDAWNDRVSSW